MALDVIDGAGNAKQLASDAVGTLHTPIHKISALPGTVEADIGLIKTFLTTIAGAIASGRMLVDLSAAVTNNIATLAGAIAAARMAVDLAATPTANLATLAGAIASQRMAVDLTSTINTYLSNLPTIASAIAPAAPKMDYVGSIGTSADVTFASQVLVKGMAIKNVSTGGQILYLKHSATPTLTNSLILLPGEWTNDIECTNANQIPMRSSMAGGAASYSGR